MTNDIVTFARSLKQLLQNSMGKRSFSQCGEDLIVQYLFSLRGVDRPSYIDIGANHPYFLSNTAIFYKNGSKGINVEANPQLIWTFKVFRPRDTNLNIGIGGKEEEMDFYVMHDNTLSTFSKQDSDCMVSCGKPLEKVKKVKVLPVSTIIEQHNNGIFPDFLSLDVEGLDFEILKSINYEQTCPKVICVEASEYSPIGAGARRDDLISFLESKGYYHYANTNLNAIMVQKDFWFSR